ncbi:MAG TPA: hypothetical protein VFH39_01360, partial [Candidatus Saccharimonadales bacterium]|nr:hypothetical protein [Candidatus Saccharimonadales bacterium]
MKLDFHHPRYVRAQAGRRLSKNGYGLLWALAVLLGGAGIALSLLHYRWGVSLVGVAIIPAMVALWWRRDLSVVPVAGTGLNDRLDVAVLQRLHAGPEPYTPSTLWQAIQPHWQARFFTNHLLLPPQFMTDQLATLTNDLNAIFSTAAELADRTGCQAVE